MKATWRASVSELRLQWLPSDQAELSESLLVRSDASSPLPERSLSVSDDSLSLHPEAHVTHCQPQASVPGSHHPTPLSTLCKTLGAHFSVWPFGEELQLQGTPITEKRCRARMGACITSQRRTQSRGTPPAGDHRPAGARATGCAASTAPHQPRAQGRASSLLAST